MATTKSRPSRQLKNSFWDAETPIAIAHRGGDAAGDDQKNTLKAFKTAQDLGYKYLETDVILAASGEVIVIHGSRNFLQAHFKGDLSRTSLQKMTLAKIRRAFKTINIQVPTLEELLTALPETRFFIDPKTDEVVFPLAKLLIRLKATDRVCIGSFYHERIRHFLRVAGHTHIPTSFIIGRGIRFVNKSLLMLKTGRLRDVEAVQLHHSLVSREMIDLVHKRGFRAIIWTCNSPLSIKNAINCGADGVISDRIQLLKEILAAKR